MLENRIFTMQENPDYKEKKVVKGSYFEVPGTPIPDPTEKKNVRSEPKSEETRGETRTDTTREKQEPKESDFKPPGELETGYKEKSWEKPQGDMESPVVNPEFQEKKEPKESDFKPPGQPETGYTEKSWKKPEDMEQKEAAQETKKEDTPPIGEGKKEEPKEEKGPVYTMEKRLTKSKTDRMLLGVCGGIGNYFGIDPTFVRLGFAAFVLLTNIVGVAIYILLAILIPSEKSVDMVPSTKSRDLKK
jgi:phage shock protein PspC (stress-responsive transcriptional regulator)